MAKKRKSGAPPADGAKKNATGTEKKVTPSRRKTVTDTDLVILPTF